MVRYLEFIADQQRAFGAASYFLCHLLHEVAGHFALQVHGIRAQADLDAPQFGVLAPFERRPDSFKCLLRGGASRCIGPHGKASTYRWDGSNRSRLRMAVSLHRVGAPFTRIAVG